MKKPLIGILLLSVALASGPARAELVSTDAVQAGAERSRVKAMVERPELAGQLQQMGLAPGEAAARVDALSDAEVHALAGRLDALVAGGDFPNQTPILLLIILIILLVLVV